MSVMQIIATAEDRVSGVMNSIQGSGSKTASLLENNWKKVTAAGVALGGTIEAMARKGQETEVSLFNLARQTNLNEKEARELTASLINATIGLEDVNDLLATGAQRGLESKEQLQGFVEFWDMVGDASGENAVKLAESSVALQVFGIGADNASEASAALGFAVDHMGDGVSGFMHVLERLGPELRGSEMSINEVAAVLAAMEHELGMTGRTAQQEFRRALNESKGDMGLFLEETGLSTEQLTKWKTEVEESGSVLEESAGAFAESRTMLQGFSAGLERLQVRYGGLINTMSDFSIALIALGPVIKGLTVAKTLWASVTWSVVAAKAALLWPITLVVAAVAALAAGVYMVIKNWDGIVDFFGGLWEGVVYIYQQAWEQIKKYLTTYNAAAILYNHWDEITDYFAGLWEGAMYIFEQAWEGFKDLFVKYSPPGILYTHWEGITDFFSGIWDGVKDVFAYTWAFLVDTVKTGTNAMITFINGPVLAIQYLINTMAKAINSLPSFNVPDWVPFIGGGTLSLPQIPTLDLPMIPTFHSGGMFRAPRPGGEGLALLKDRETVLTENQARGGGTVNISFEGLFAGANIRMGSREDARQVSEEMFGSFRAKLRAEGIKG